MKELPYTSLFIKNKREEANLTQEELAKISKKEVRFIKDVESGNLKYTIKEIDDVLKVFDYELVPSYKVVYDNRENQEMYSELYSKLGLMVHLSQLVEYNLWLYTKLSRLAEDIKIKGISSIDEFKGILKSVEEDGKKLFKKPMGVILKETKKYLDERIYNYLDEITKRRNNFMHKFFKYYSENDFSKKDQNETFSALEHLIEMLYDMNQILSIYVNDKKKELKLPTD